MKTDDPPESRRYSTSSAGIGLAIGAGIGLVFGMLVPSIGIAVCMPIGAVIGLTLGAELTPKRKGKAAKGEVSGT